MSVIIVERHVDLIASVVDVAVSSSSDPEHIADRDVSPELSLDAQSDVHRNSEWSSTASRITLLEPSESYAPRVKRRYMLDSSSHSAPPLRTYSSRKAPAPEQPRSRMLPPEPPTPLELRNFLSSLRVNQEHLAPIFIKYGFDSDIALDFLCEIPLVDWADMKQEIIEGGRLIGWLAIQRGLLERAQTLGITNDTLSAAHY